MGILSSSSTAATELYGLKVIIGVDEDTEQQKGED